MKMRIHDTRKDGVIIDTTCVEEIPVPHVGVSLKAFAFGVMALIVLIIVALAKAAWATVRWLWATTVRS